MITRSTGIIALEVRVNVQVNQETRNVHICENIIILQSEGSLFDTVDDKDT